MSGLFWLGFFVLWHINFRGLFDAKDLLVEELPVILFDPLIVVYRLGSMLVYVCMYVCMYVCVCVCGCIYIHGCELIIGMYMCMCAYVRVHIGPETYVVHSISFQTFLYRHLKLKIQYLIAVHLMRWLANFYDFGFKWTPTAAIRIHPTKAWLSLLVNFKNAIWKWGHFRRTICNKILF